MGMRTARREGSRVVLKRGQHGTLGKKKRAALRGPEGSTQIVGPKPNRCRTRVQVRWPQPITTTLP